METENTEVLLAFVEASPYLAVFLIVVYIFKDIIKEWLKKPISKTKPISNLQFHDMFTTANSVRSKVNAIKFSTHGEDDKIKSRMLHKLIDLKIECVKERFKEFLLQDKLDKLDGNQLKFKIAAALSGIVKEYNEKAFNYFVNEYGISKEDSKYLIDCYEIFRQDIVDGFLSRLESITKNEDYTTNYEKISAVLEVVAISLYIIPKDSKNAMNLANGRFIKYKEHEEAVRKNS